MANKSKGERKMIGIRMPVELIEKAKKEAQRCGLGLNDYYVMAFRKGLAAVEESGHDRVQSARYIV